MKKILTLLLALCLVFAAVGCAPANLSHSDFMAAEDGEEVTIEAYVQAKQGWWNDQAVVYLQTAVGGFFVYSLPCTEAEYDELVPGTKVQVTGTKAVYNGMNEINPASSFKIISGDTYVADPIDITDKLADENALVKYQGMFVQLSNMTVVKVEYKNGEPGDDVYVTLAKGEDQFKLTIEVYLTGTDTDVYEAAGTLNAGDVVDVRGYVQWWNAFDMHITQIIK